MVPILEFHSSLQTTKFVGVVVGEWCVAGSSSAGGGGGRSSIIFGGSRQYPPHLHQEVLKARGDVACGLQYLGPIVNEGQGVVDHRDGP